MRMRTENQRSVDQRNASQRIADRSRERQKTVMTFTVAECGEFHSLGECHEGIKTLEEAVGIYRQIPPERMNGIPSIGINLHVEGRDRREDAQVDILTGEGIEVGFISFMPEFRENPQVQDALMKLIQEFPEKEVITY